MSAPMHSSVFYAQNFLKSPDLVATLLDTFDLQHDDSVYEIGPGKGIITAQLALRYKQVIAIEKDPHLFAMLQQHFANQSNLMLYCGDFLCYKLPCGPYKVFANIPFNLTSAIVNKLTETVNPPDDAYLIMQKEAAAMFLGQSPVLLRAVLLHPWFEITIVHHFQRKDFYPAPRVDVVMLRLRKRGPPLIQSADRQCFRDFVVYTFTTWQPLPATPLNRLFTSQQLKYLQEKLQLAADSTPTSIDLEKWLKLFSYFKAVRNKRTMQMIAGSEKRLLQQQRRLQKIHRTR